ncbi:MAG: hypothetical protein ACK583_16845 [Cyanobacteriota bacterium]
MAERLAGRLAGIAGTHPNHVLGLARDQSRQERANDSLVGRR